MCNWYCFSDVLCVPSQTLSFSSYDFTFFPQNLDFNHFSLQLKILVPIFSVGLFCWIQFLRLLILWEVFIYAFIYFAFNYVEYFAGYVSLGCLSLSFKIWNVLLQALQIFKVYNEKLFAIVMGFSLHVTCGFFILSCSFQYTLFIGILTRICLGDFLFQTCLIDDLCQFLSLGNLLL